MDPDIPLATAQTWRPTWLWVAAQATPICMALGQYDPQAPTWPQLPAQTPGICTALMVTGAVDINTDPSYSGAKDPTMALHSGSDMDKTIALGSNTAHSDWHSP